jgi:hypothetical protein
LTLLNSFVKKLFTKDRDEVARRVSHAGPCL